MFGVGPEKQDGRDHPEGDDDREGGLGIVEDETEEEAEPTDRISDLHSVPREERMVGLERFTRLAALLPDTTIVITEFCESCVPLLSVSGSTPPGI